MNQGQDFSASNLPEKYGDYQNNNYMDGRQIDIEHDNFIIDSGTAFPNGYIYDLRGSQEHSETESYQDFIFGANDDDAFNFDYDKMGGDNLFTPDEKGKNQFSLGEEGGYLEDSDMNRVGRSNYFDGVDFEITEAFNGGELVTTANEMKNFELEKEGVKVNAFLSLENSKITAEGSDRMLFGDEDRGSNRRRRSKFYETSN